MCISETEHLRCVGLCGSSSSNPSRSPSRRTLPCLPNRATPAAWNDPCTRTVRKKFNVCTGKWLMYVAKCSYLRSSFKMSSRPKPLMPQQMISTLYRIPQLLNHSGHAISKICPACHPPSAQVFPLVRLVETGTSLFYVRIAHPAFCLGQRVRTGVWVMWGFYGWATHPTA